MPTVWSLESFSSELTRFCVSPCSLFLSIMRWYILPLAYDSSFSYSVIYTTASVQNSFTPLPKTLEIHHSFRYFPIYSNILKQWFYVYLVLVTGRQLVPRLWIICLVPAIKKYKTWEHIKKNQTTFKVNKIHMCTVVIRPWRVTHPSTFTQEKTQSFVSSL